MKNEEKTKNKEKTKSFSGLFDVGLIMLLLAPLLYTAGWSFAYHYFEQFHMGLLGLDIPREYFFLYGFWTIKDQLLYSLGGMGATVIIYFLVKFLQQWVKLSQVLGLILTPVLVLSLFVLFYHLGDLTAESSFKAQAKLNFPSYPRVKVWLENAGNNETKAISGEWEKGCYRLLLRNKENLYLFWSGNPGGKIPTEIIPKSKVRFVRVLPQYHSCKE